MNDEPTSTPAPRFDDPTAPAPADPCPSTEYQPFAYLRASPPLACPPGWRIIAMDEMPQPGDYARKAGSSDQWRLVEIPSFWNLGGQRNPDVEFRRQETEFYAPGSPGAALRDRENALAYLKARDIQAASVLDAVQYLFESRRGFVQ